MTCPIYGGITTVFDTHKDYDAVYRRRKCKECGYYFFTTEVESDGKMYRELDNLYHGTRREFKREKKEVNK